MFTLDKLGDRIRIYDHNQVFIKDIKSKDSLDQESTTIILDFAFCETYLRVIHT